MKPAQDINHRTYDSAGDVLLNLEEERILSKRMSYAKESLRKLFRKYKIKLPDNYENFKDVLKNLNGEISERDKRRIKTLDSEISKVVNTFVLHNQRLAFAKSWKYVHSRAESEASQDDYCQMSLVYLMNVAWKYDGRGKFSTYASWWLNQGLQREVPSHRSIIRIPFKRLEAVYKMKIGMGEKSEENINLKALRASSGIKSIDNRLKSGIKIFEPSVESEEAKIDAEIDFKNLAEKIRNCSLLTNQERLVVAYLFLDNQATGEQKTLQEVSEIMRVTRERVRQVKAKALQKIRRSFPEYALSL